MGGKQKKTKFIHFKRKPYCKVSISLNDLPNNQLQSVDHQQLMDDSNISSSLERDRNTVLLLDEMHVREDFVYDKHSGNKNVKLSRQNHQPR